MAGEGHFFRKGFYFLYCSYVIMGAIKYIYIYLLYSYIYYYFIFLYGIRPGRISAWRGRDTSSGKVVVVVIIVVIALEGLWHGGGGTLVPDRLLL